MSRFYTESLALERTQSPARQFNATPSRSVRYEINEVLGFSQTGNTRNGVISRCNALPWPTPPTPDDSVSLGGSSYHFEYDQQSPVSPYNYSTNITNLFTSDTDPVRTLNTIIWNAFPAPWFTLCLDAISFWLDWAYADRLLSDYSPYFYARRVRVRTRPGYPCILGTGRLYGTRPAWTFPIGRIGVTDITFASEESVIGNYQPFTLDVPSVDNNFGRVSFLLIGANQSSFNPLPGLQFLP